MTSLNVPKLAWTHCPPSLWPRLRCVTTPGGRAHPERWGVAWVGPLHRSRRSFRTKTVSRDAQLERQRRSCAETALSPYVVSMASAGKTEARLRVERIDRSQNQTGGVGWGGGGGGGQREKLRIVQAH